MARNYRGGRVAEIFEKLARSYNPWLSDVEIYIMDDKVDVHKIRDI